MVKKTRSKRSIYYPETYFSDESEDEDNPFFLMKKTVKPKKNSEIYDYFKDLKKKKKKIALVLSGGAARGLAHMGVIKTLHENDIIPDLIIGTSMGSIVGAMYAMDMDPDIFDKFLNYELKDLVSFNDLSIHSGGLIKGNKVNYILSKIFGRPLTFDELKIPMIINACDLKTGEEVIFKEGKVMDAVRASISIPFVFKPHKVDDMLLVDGGMVSPAAVHLVPKNFHATILSDVNCELNKMGSSPGLGQIFEQIMVLYHQNLLKIKPKSKHFVMVAPDLKGLRLLHFNRGNEFVKRGRKATEAVMDDIKKSIS